jgi:hypothetical protein
LNSPLQSGGGTSLRGFAARRFVDRNSLLRSAEYRWRPSRNINGEPFVLAKRQDPTAAD